MKAYTDISQSKKLAEILPIESADMEYMFLKKDGSKVSNVPFVKDEFEEPECSECGYIFIPCWSLAALLKMLKDYQLFSNGLIVYIDNDSYKIDSDNPVDACVEIIKLNKQKLL